MNVRMLASALAYARDGWAVFPVKERGKQPLTPHGFKDATTDEATIKRWWRQHPNANIGHAVPAGTVVVDIDGEEGRASLNGHALPDTLTARTGRGEHRFYASETRIAPRAGIRPGIDLRGPGSYVVLPPSVHASGKRYAWDRISDVSVAPAWITSERAAHEVTGGGAAIRAGERDSTLTSLAGSMRRRGMTESEIFGALAIANAERCDPPLPEPDIRRIARSVARYDAESLDGMELPDLMHVLGARTLEDVTTDPPPPMLLDRIDPEGHTVLFGTGGVGKGVVASSWIAALTQAGQRVVLCDYENHPDEWARRIAGLRGDRSKVVIVTPLTAAWTAKRGAIWTHADSLRALAEAFAADIAVIDSIVPACAGTDPLKPEAAALYAGAIEYLGVPAVSLGHVTKADDLRYPFGSVFWHNLARTTWSLHRDDHDRTILSHRKHNNYAARGRFAVDSAWMNGHPVTVAETPYGVTLRERIADVLADSTQTVEQIVAALKDEGDPVKANSVRVALRRGGFVETGDGWSSAR